MRLFRNTALAAALAVLVCSFAGCANTENGSSSDISSEAPESSTASQTESTDTTEQSSSPPVDTSESDSSEPADTTSEPVTSEPDDEWNPALANERKTIEDNGCLAGMAYIGYIEPESNADDCREMFLESEYSVSFPEVCDIPNEMVVMTGGCELYLIIPQSGMTAEVYESRFVDDGENITFVNGEMLFSSEFGAPFLLKCNVSDIMSDVSIELTSADGEKYDSWSPCLSLENGKATIYNANVKVYDFSIYETEYQDIDI